MRRTPILITLSIIIICGGALVHAQIALLGHKQQMITLLTPPPTLPFPPGNAGLGQLQLGNAQLGNDYPPTAPPIAPANLGNAQLASMMLGDDHIPLPAVLVMGGEQVVWQHSTGNCVNTDIVDVPPRPYVNASNGINWVAGSDIPGYYVTTGPTDLSSFTRNCAQNTNLSASPEFTGTPGGNPGAYRNGVWLAAPFTTDGTNIYALVHNEYDSLDTGSGTNCNGGPCCTSAWLQSAGFNTCTYWNITGATSANGGTTFSLNNVQGDGSIHPPAIALPDVYQFSASNPTNSTTGPIGMDGQTNIIQWGSFYYVITLQVQNATNAITACIWRTSSITSPVWTGWSSNTNSYSIASPSTYPSTIAPANSHCTGVLPANVSWTSWAYSAVLGKFIIMAQNGNANPVPGFEYQLATINQSTGQLTTVGPEVDIWDSPVPGADLYPTILDSTSPTLLPSDRNFQYVGSRPYLYWVRLNAAVFNNTNLYDRDVVRAPLSISTNQ